VVVNPKDQLKPNRVHHELLRRPVATSRTLEKQTGLSHVTVNNTLDHLCRLGLTRELTGHKRNRVFSYTAYLAILNEGTEPLGNG
jgi:Fic family protein